MAGNIHHYEIFCFDCKKHFGYDKKNKADALKEFDSYGHSNQKTSRLKKDIGRGSSALPRFRSKRGK